MSITIEGGSLLSSVRENALAQRVQQAKTIPADVYAEDHSLRPIVDEEVAHDRYDTAFSQEDVEEASVEAANQQSTAVAQEAQKAQVLHGNSRAVVEHEPEEMEEVSTIDYLLDQKMRNESTPEVVLETANAVRTKETQLASSTEATRELSENPVEHVVHQIDKKQYRTNVEPDLSERTKTEMYLDNPRYTQSSWTLFETLENVEKTSPEPPDVKTTINFYDTTIADPGESTIQPAPEPIGQRESPIKAQAEVNFRKEQMEKLQVKAKDQTEVVSKSGNISPQAPAPVEIQPTTTAVDVAVTPVVDTPQVEAVQPRQENQSGGMGQENQREKTTQDNRRPQAEAEPAPEFPPVFQEKEPVVEPVTTGNAEPVVEVEIPDIEVDLPVFQPVTVEAKPAPEPVEIPEPTAPFLEETDTVSITEVANEEDYFPPLPGNASLQDGADVANVTEYFPPLPGTSVDAPDPLADTITESSVAAAETAVEFEMPELPGSISREEAAFQRVNAANNQIAWVEETYTPDLQEPKPDLVDDYDPFASQGEEWFPEALTFQATGQTIETNEFGGADLTQFEEKYIPETVAPTPEEAYDAYILDANRVSEAKEKYIPEELFDIFS